MSQYRHGDVLLTRVGCVPFPTGDVVEDEIVLAKGEVTGHAHRMRGVGIGLLDIADEDVIGRRRLVVPRGGRLTHEEHGTIYVPPGVYDVRIQRTMTQAGQWEQVRD